MPPYDTRTEAPHMQTWYTYHRLHKAYSSKTCVISNYKIQENQKYLVETVISWVGGQECFLRTVCFHLQV